MALPSSSAPHEADKPAPRFAFVDGLRGLAALGIVIFHAWWYEPQPHSLLSSAHWMFDAAFLRTRGGVQILLVISGFVIAYSLRNTWVTPRETLTFIGRRIVRLVPAYWFALGFVISVGWLCRGPLHLPSPFDDDVSGPRLLAHLVFLQDVFHFTSLSAGLWTVCIEMQFYFVAVLAWGLAQQILPRPMKEQPRPSVTALLVVFAPLALGSLMYSRLLESYDSWVPYFLWRFCLGMITWWTLERSLPGKVFAAFVVIAAGQLVYEVAWDPLFEWPDELPSSNAIGLAAALALYAAGRAERLHVWLNCRWLQFVGRISYSLYLIHFPVSHVITTTGWKWCGHAPSVGQAVVIFGVSISASLLAGSALYVWVEAPSARWAAKMKR